MKKVFIIILIILILIVVGGGVFFLLGNKGTGKETGEKEQINSPSTTEQAIVNDQTMVDCGLAEDPMCFLSRLNGCLPVTTKMIGSDGKTDIEMTILGVENEKCHFQRKINNSVDLDCYFPKGTLSWDTIDQTFGNDKGLQKVVDDACGKAGW